MLILLLLLMTYSLTGQLLHELIGIAMLICFLFHQLLNHSWYRMIGKGSYTSIRRIYFITNALLLIDILLMFLSGFSMSRLLPFLAVMSTETARRLHLLATHWGFVLMAIHVGYHDDIFLRACRLKLPVRSRRVSLLITLIPYILSVYGIWVFMKNQWIGYLLLLNEFVYLDESIGFIQMIMELVGVFILCSTLAYQALHIFAIAKKQI